MNLIGIGGGEHNLVNNPGGEISEGPAPACSECIFLSNCDQFIFFQNMDVLPSHFCLCLQAIFQVRLAVDLSIS